MKLKYRSLAFIILPVTVAFIGIFFCFFGNKGEIPKENIEALKISSETLTEITEVSNLLGIDYKEAVENYLLYNNFFDEKTEYREEEVKQFFKSYKSIKEKYNHKKYKPCKDLVKGILTDLKAFPTESEFIREISYSDSYGAPRTYGGKRIHKGCDIFDSENIRGRIKVVSMTDGVVENLGWNEKGGYRAGIRTDNNIYYYYAHLDSYAEGLKKGKTVKAGELLGYMGDSGYSKTEGAKGNFPVHLHVGIAANVKGYKGELWINPYPFLKCLEAGVI